MSKSTIALSPKHGLNPSLGLCFWCGAPDGTVVIPGLLKGDAEAPHQAVWSMDPCDKCKENMALGITLMEATLGPTNKPEPTGRWVVVTEDCVNRNFDPMAAAQTLRHRKAFLEPEVFVLLLVRRVPNGTMLSSKESGDE